VKEMLEAGAHFGHQTHRWNPLMKPYIYGARNGIHIIDLEKTVRLFRVASDFITRVVAEGGSVLFVGTKKQAQLIVTEEAKKAGMFYVVHRWLGGTLTNFPTIRASIDRLKDLEKKKTEGGFEGRTKKEKLNLEREMIKLERSFGGIKEMRTLPNVLFIVDPSTEAIAQKEANRLGIPVVALVDTNCNPEGIDYLIPGNDDAIKSIRLFTARIAQACLDGLAQKAVVMRSRVVEGGKGKSFVLSPEAYEKEVAGEYKAEQASGDQ